MYLSSKDVEFDTYSVSLKCPRFWKHFWPLSGTSYFGCGHEIGPQKSARVVVYIPFGSTGYYWVLNRYLISNQTRSFLFSKFEDIFHLQWQNCMQANEPPRLRRATEGRERWREPVSGRDGRTANGRADHRSGFRMPACHGVIEPGTVHKLTNTCLLYDIVGG